MGKFDFQRFSVDDAGCAMKVGTDSVLLGAWADVTAVNTVLDLGAGSGLLALMVAQRCYDAKIEAIEIDPGAAEAAASNFADSPWHDRLSIVCADAMTIGQEARYDLIICNPPYFTADLRSPDGQRTQARHVDGLGPVEAVAFAAQHLSAGGTLAMVTPAEYDADVTFKAEMQRLKIWRKCMVSTRKGKTPTRILWQIAKSPCRFSPTSLDIRDAENRLTDEYKQITKDFYISYA